MIRTALVSICFASVFAAGCFDAPKPACAFLCGDDGACPDGYTCAPEEADGSKWCKRADVDPSFMCDDTTPTTIDAAVDIDSDTTPDATPIDAAAIDAGFALGTSCTSGGQCNSGFCSDSVCCDAACTGDCDACSTAAGSDSDGSCDFLATECRATADECDVAETCTGSSATCPIDGFAGSGTQCADTATDDCDDAQCDGSGACVQAGGVELSSFVCRAAAGDCDVAENCNGSDGGACPVDLFEASDVQCTDSSPTNCEDARCDGAGLCVQDFANEAMDSPCGPGVAEPTCNPDVCDAGGVCINVAVLPNETACPEAPSGDCCTGVCTDTSGSGDMCP